MDTVFKFEQNGEWVTITIDNNTENMIEFHYTQWELFKELVNDMNVSKELAE